MTPDGARILPFIRPQVASADNDAAPSTPPPAIWEQLEALHRLIDTLDQVAGDSDAYRVLTAHIYREVALASDRLSQLRF